MKNPLISVLASTLLFASCGGSPSSSCATGTICDPVVVTNPISPSDTSANIALFAKATANSTKDDNFAPDFAIDGILPDPTNTRTYMWRPSAINSSILTLTWNSQVTISGLQLYDNPKIGQNLKKGKVEFFNTGEPSIAFGQTDFAALPDDGKTPLQIAGPSQPVTGIRIYILDHVGDEAGVAEAVVLGERVDEEIPEGNVTPYCMVSKYSSVKNPIDTDTDTGAYRSTKIKDGSETGSEWVSNGNGVGAYIEIQCDLAYSITEITVVDRTGYDISTLKRGTRLIGGNLTFEDVSEMVRFTKLKTDLAATVSLPSAKVTKKILVSFSEGDVVDGTYTGLSELKIKGSYKPISN
jgi:hypothetical protein